MSIRVLRRLAALFVATVLLLLSPAWASAQAAEVDALVRAQMAARQGPRVSMAVVKDSQVASTRGHGLAGVEHRLPAIEQTR